MKGREISHSFTSTDLDGQEEAQLLTLKFSLPVLPLQCSRDLLNENTLGPTQHNGCLHHDDVINKFLNNMEKLLFPSVSCTQLLPILPNPDASRLDFSGQCLDGFSVLACIADKRHRRVLGR